VTRLESRKQALIAQSELNRARMVADLVWMSSSARALSEKARTLGLIASSTATLVAGLAAYQRRNKQVAAAKPSWPQTILAGAGLASSIWLAIQSQKSGPNDN
jgi:hypothetical protein